MVVNLFILDSKEMKNNQYIQFAIKGIKFLIIFFLIDFTLGTITEYLFYNQSTGKYARITDSLQKTDADMIVFGSSHAHRHYVPEIFERKLNLSFYNAGVQGQQLLFHSALHEIVLSRTTPKVIIVNYEPNWFFVSRDSYERLSNLSPYYTYYPEILKPILNLKSNLENVKLISKGYRYNSIIVHVLRYYIKPQYAYKGYRPLMGKMKPVNYYPEIVPANNVSDTRQIDPNCVEALKKLIKRTKEKGIELIFISTPNPKGDVINNRSSQMIKSIIREEQLRLINLTNHPEFTGRFEYFNDPGHLNKLGSIVFSEIATDSLQKVLKATHKNDYLTLDESPHSNLNKENTTAKN